MSEFTFKRRNEGGNTPTLERWNMNSEYGVLKDVLIGPMDNYAW